MKLSTMQMVGSTVGVNRSCPTAERILECWGFDQESVQTVRFSTNFVFVFRQQGTKRFLRFSPAWERQVEHIQSETEFLMRLVNGGLQVAQPLRSNFGNLVETVDTDLGSFHAVVFTALDGNHLQLDELSEPHFRQWGAALGRLHAACKTDRFEGLKRPSWREHLRFIRDHLSDNDHCLLREWETMSTWAESLPSGADDFGLIHFDFELDNLCWNAQEIQMLDFDDCSYHWYAADIALALRELFNDGADADYDDIRFQAFLQGYRSVCPIEDAWLKRLPMFLRMRKLLGYADLVNSVDLSIHETHNWLKPLNQRLRKSMETYELSLNS